MSKNHQVKYLSVQGRNGFYPQYGEANLSLIDHFQSTLKGSQRFLTSPLYEFSNFTYSNSIDTGKKKIVFFIIPSPFPLFHRIFNKFSIDKDCYFTIGLTNLILFLENENNLDSDISKFLFDNYSIKAQKEIWFLNNGILEDYKIEQNQREVVKRDVNFNPKLPNHVQFILSEYITSQNKILSAIKTYVPYLYDDYVNIFSEADRFLFKIERLYGLRDNEGGIKEKNEDFSEVNEYVNECLGTLVQLNSALSYVYSQTFSGSFPLLDNKGLINRYSLLGIGSSIKALYSIVNELEELFSSINIGDFINDTLSSWEVNKYPGYNTNKSFMKVFSDDNNRNSLVIQNSPKIEDLQSFDDKFLNRLSYYSGRLGFREHNLSATAALQVLVDGFSLEWNVINYSHEIIHDHVRTILNNIFDIPKYSNKEELYKSLKTFLINFDPNKDEKYSYKDYIKYLILAHYMQSEVLGSLQKSWNNQFKDFIKSGNPKFITEDELDDLPYLFETLYKGLSEIFVHIIDYSYVYHRYPNIYIKSIWSSWALVSAVNSDMDQYILRSILVLSTTESDEPEIRFKKSVDKFVSIIEEMEQESSSTIFSKILELLDGYEKDEIPNDSKLFDYRCRFLNCLPVADLAYNFFVMNTERFLDNNDSNLNENFNPLEDSDLYDVEIGTFQNKVIKSKLRFALNNVNYSIHNETESKSEWLSAWSLVALSSESKN